MALAALRSVVASVRKNGLRGTLREAKENGLLSALLDGNLMETKLHTIGATLVGTDSVGNKYWEKTIDTQFGRHRWVEYADYKNYNASAVPPEWHGWLHYITDHTPEQLEGLKPKYALPHKENMSGRGDGMIYHSKGHALNPNKRDWKRYEAWQPEAEIK
jgi:NADH dehydrogenase (ubiquinone) 1 alpha subcomplex subunit 12